MLNRIVHGLGWLMLVLNALMVPAMLIVGEYHTAAFSALWVVLLFWMLRD